MTFVKTALFHKAGEGSGGGGGGSDPHNLGFYADLTALQTAHPTGSDGDFAILGSTDTVWVWDSGTSAWKDTDTKGQVTSVNGQTGAVVIPDELPSQTGNSGKFLTTDGTDASWAAVGALPDQTGQSGKFLTTDGTDASWATVNALQNTATANRSLTIIGNAVTTADGISIGYNSTCSNYGTLALGSGTKATNSGSIAIGGPQTISSGNNAVAFGNAAEASGSGSVALGGASKSTQTGAIQLGPGQNSTANSFQVGLNQWENNQAKTYMMLSPDGTIPTARLTKVNTTITLTAAGWSSNTQTVNVTGMTADGVVMVSPDPTDQSAYTSAGILCTAQAAGTLTFTCDTVPSGDIDVNVVML